MVFRKRWCAIYHPLLSTIHILSHKLLHIISSNFKALLSIFILDDSHDSIYVRVFAEHTTFIELDVSRVASLLTLDVTGALGLDVTISNKDIAYNQFCL